MAASSVLILATAALPAAFKSAISPPPSRYPDRFAVSASGKQRKQLLDVQAGNLPEDVVAEIILSLAFISEVVLSFDPLPVRVIGVAAEYNVFHGFNSSYFLFFLKAGAESVIIEPSRPGGC